MKLKVNVETLHCCSSILDKALSRLRELQDDRAVEKLEGKAEKDTKDHKSIKSGMPSYNCSVGRKDGYLPSKDHAVTKLCYSLVMLYIRFSQYINNVHPCSQIVHSMLNLMRNHFFQATREEDQLDKLTLPNDLISKIRQQLVEVFDKRYVDLETEDFGKVPAQSSDRKGSEPQISKMVVDGTKDKKESSIREELFRSVLDRKEFETVRQIFYENDKQRLST